MTPRSPSARDEWWLLLGALLALGGWIAYLAHAGQREHELRAREQLFAQAEVVHDNLTRQLDAIQRAQRNIRAEWGDGAHGERLPASIGRQLRAFAEIMPAVRAMAVLDAQGRVLASSRTEQVGTDESARDHFRVPRAQPDAERFYVTPPYVGAPGDWAMNVGTTLHDARGEFVGVVTTTLDSDALARLLQSARFERDMRVGLNHGDGVVLVSMPAVRERYGMSLAVPGSFYSRHVASGQAESLFVGSMYASQTERMAVLRSIQPPALAMDKPLMVAVSRDLSVLWAAWRREVGLNALLFGVLALSSAAWLHRLQRRRQEQALAARTAAAALQDNESRLDAMLQAMPIGLCLIDAAERIVYRNPRMVELIGYDATDVPTLNEWRALAYADPAYRDAVIANWQTALKRAAAGDGRIEPVELKVTAKSGHPLHLLTSGTLLGEQVLVAFVDVTALKQTQAALAQAHDRLQQIAARVPGVVYQFRRHADGRSSFPYASDAARELFDVDPEAIREDASAVFARVHPDDLADLMASIEISASTLSPWSHEFRVQKADGTSRWLAGNAAPVREGNGDTLWHGFVSDITERKLAEAELDAHRHHLQALVDERTRELTLAKEAAEAANVAKSAFLANMSHEIRTPLNAISGMTYLLRKAEVSPQKLDRLDKIEHARQHLLALIDNILDLSRIEARKLELQRAPVDLGQIIANVRSMLGAQAQAKGLSLLHELPELTDVLLGDPMRIQQALLNYVANAVKFTDAGSVTVRVGAQAQAQDRLLLRFEVQDTGPGIDAATAARLFTAFEQADNSITRRFGGSGLGLVITRRLAQMMGGDAGVLSLPGRGSTFWFSALVERLNPPHKVRDEAAGDAEPAPPDLRGRRVLLAEDEPINREVMQLLLQDCGLAVDCAEDGGQAVERLQHQAYDLVLMDMQMPRMDGLEATRRLRALPHGRSVPVVAVTANAFADDRQLCLQAGMSDFIAKPVDPRALYAVLARWLGARGATDDAPR